MIAPVEVGPSPAGEEDGDTCHVVVAAEPAQRGRRRDRVADRIERGRHHLRREGPGATAFTVTCCGPSSLASTLVSWCSAALLLAYE